MENREAIEMLERFQNPEPWEPKITDRAYEALQIAISALENQDADRWIPVTESLPEYRVEVLAQFSGSFMDINWVIDEEDAEWFEDGVIAWRPLPEPYTEEES